jgi:septal ring factor EnvC (AmiA/AmiB activator)
MNMCVRKEVEEALCQEDAGLLRQVNELTDRNLALANLVEDLTEGQAGLRLDLLAKEERITELLRQKEALETKVAELEDRATNAWRRRGTSAAGRDILGPKSH